MLPECQRHAGPLLCETSYSALQCWQVSKRFLFLAAGPAIFVRFVATVAVLRLELVLTDDTLTFEVVNGGIVVVGGSATWVSSTRNRVIAIFSGALLCLIIDLRTAANLF
jgi:hypothetical protein